MKENETDAVLNFLRTINKSCQSSLKALLMNEFEVNDALLEILLFSRSYRICKVV